MQDYPGFDFRPPTTDELYVHIINSDIDVASKFVRSLYKKCLIYL